MLSETRASHFSTEATRPWSMAALTAAVLVGFTSGPLLLSMTGTMGALPFLIGAIQPLAVRSLIGVPRLIEPEIHGSSRAKPLRTLRLAPIAMAAAPFNAAVETAGSDSSSSRSMQPASGGASCALRAAFRSSWWALSSCKLRCAG